MFLLNLAGTLKSSLRAGHHGLPSSCLEAEAYDITEFITKPKVFSVSEQLNWHSSILRNRKGQI